MDTNSDERASLADPSFNSSARSALLGLIPNLLVNGACPFVLYELLTGSGVPVVTALALTSAFPLGAIGIGWARRGSLDAIGVMSLIFIALGLGTSLVSGNPRFYLVKESFGTAGFGVAALASLLLPRPLLFYLSLQGATSGNPETVAAWNAMWSNLAGFRRVFYTMTAVWACAFLVEAAVRVVLALVATPSVVLVVSPLMAYGIVVLLLLWSFRYAASSRRRAQQGVGSSATALASYT